MKPSNEHSTTASVSDQYGSSQAQAAKDQNYDNLRKEEKFEKPNSSSSSSANRRRTSMILRPKFEFSPLPTWELIVYFTIITAMFIVCWSTTVYVSDLSPPELLNGWRFQYSHLPSLKWPRYRDISDYEWTVVYEYLPTMAALLAGNSVLFELVHRLLPDVVDEERVMGAVAQDRTRKIIMIAYSLLGSWALLLPISCLLKMVLQSALVFGLTKLAGYQLVTWLSVAGVLSYNFSYTDPGDGVEMFISMLYLQYSLFHYASYCIEEIVYQPTPGIWWLDEGINYVFYYTYLPFKTYLIMPYRLFQKRLTERHRMIASSRRDWGHIAAFAFRLLFWYYVCEILCHYCYFKPVVRNLDVFPEWVQESRIVLGSVYFCMGIFFHMKYVVIFGVPSLFLHIDKMQPMRPPICVARVSLYSRIWREFDRGLYLFIKEGVYKPICRPTFSLQRKAIAGIIVFLVVLVWHDVSRGIVIWILMNIFVLIARGVALAVYNRNDKVYRFCHESLSPVNLRRLLAFLQMPLVIISLISIFYFLAGDERGDSMAYLFLYEDWISKPGLNTLGQIVLGYVFAQFCIQVNIRVEARQERENRCQLHQSETERTRDLLDKKYR